MASIVMASGEQAEVERGPVWDDVRIERAVVLFLDEIRRQGAPLDRVIPKLRQSRRTHYRRLAESHDARGLN